LVSLVIPDKRFGFDFFKPITATSDYLYAHYCQRTRHTKKTAFDYVAYNVAESAAIGWPVRPLGSFDFSYNEPLKVAQKRFDETIEDESGPYVDYHATIYTPSSFALIVLELGQMGVLPFQIELTFPTSGPEFCVSLRHGTPVLLKPDKSKIERLRLMKNTIRELGQQARWLLDDEQIEHGTTSLQTDYNRDVTTHSELERRIRALETNHRELEGQYNQKSQEYKSMQDVLENILTSRSWRLTEPLRRAMRLMKGN
jgi:hypothetical protein